MIALKDLVRDPPALKIDPGQRTTSCPRTCSGVMASAWAGARPDYGQLTVHTPIHLVKGEYCRTAVTAAFLSHGQGVIRGPAEPAVTATELYWLPGLAGCLLHRHA